VNVEGRFGCADDKDRGWQCDGAGWEGVDGGGAVEYSHWGRKRDLDLPGEMQANLDASTHDGRISLGIPVMVEGTFSTTKILGKMNGGGQTIVVRTGDGSTTFE